MPSWPQGFFNVALASDADGDGLTDGYEALISGSDPNNRETDGHLPDGWKAEWGLDVSSTSGPNGPFGDPDHDGISNINEWNNGVNSTDPWRTNSNPRPVVSIAFDNGAFQITRSGASFSSSLAVNYTVGGTAIYGQDYTLNPAPAGSFYPYSITIPAESASVTLNSTLQTCATNALIVGLVPYSLADLPPTNWFYVVDPFHDRATTGNLVVSTNATPLQLAQMLVGPGITVTNATFTGTDVARGTFAGGIACNLPIDCGVILDSGYITDVIGPPSYQNPDGEFGLPDDTDLDNLVGGGGEDAAVLEFDIISSTNSVTFQNFFASEEYLYWVGSPYNDVCGIFIDGTNIAVVPGTSQPVCVNNVNPGSNAQYYENNPLGANVVNMQYIGLTTLFTAQTTISTNVVHHVKIAIEDVADDANDSAIFLKASLSCNCN